MTIGEFISENALVLCKGALATLYGTCSLALVSIDDIDKLLKIGVSLGAICVSVVTVFSIIITTHQKLKRIKGRHEDHQRHED